jgi:iduronate 2-sulfatase
MKKYACKDGVTLALLLFALGACGGTDREPENSSATSASGASASPREHPNVLFLIADDLTAGALGCYGNEDVKTPSIDALSKQGLRFDRAYCQFPVCGASRAAIMSGLYPPSIGVMGNGDANHFAERLADRPSLGEHFIRAGYHSARVSKIYHMRVPGDITAGVDGPDHAASWTERHNCRGAEWMTPGPSEHLSYEKLQRDPTRHYGLGFGTAFYVVRSEGDGADQPDHQAATRAIEIMKRQGDQPFFLAVGFVRPHVPLVAPAPWHDAHPAQDMSLPEHVAGDRDDIPKLGHSYDSEYAKLTTTNRKQRVLSAYYAATSFMDAQVGRILRAVDELGLAENTIVVFTSDHGYHLGEHDFWQKMSLHEESARIPLIIKAPGCLPGTTPRLAQQIDLYPTLADLAGLTIPEHLEGRSLAPILRDPEHGVRVHDAVYCFKRQGTLRRTEQQAYIEWRDGTSELYDMEGDPKQFWNRSGDEDTRRDLEKHRSELASFLATFSR